MSETERCSDCPPVGYSTDRTRCVSCDRSAHEQLSRAFGEAEADKIIATKNTGKQTMPEYDMSIHTNPDAAAWVKFFRESNPDCNVPDDLMLTWFANAMMAMHDHLTGQRHVVLPDGSAFFVATVEANGA